MAKTIDVDTRTFIRFWLVLLGFAFLGFMAYRALTGIVIIGISIFLAIALQPLAEKISKFTKQNRTISSVLAYVIAIGAVSIILAVIGPVVIGETTQFVGQLPAMFEDRLGGWSGINSFGQQIGISDLESEIMNSIQAFSSGFINNLGNMVMAGVGTVSQFATGLVLVLVLTILLMLEGKSIVQNFWHYLEKRHRKSNIKTYQRLTERMVNVVAIYVSRQVMVAILDGCVVAIAVFLLSLMTDLSSNLALPMGLVAMIFYLIPMFGPVISCILISLILLFSSPLAAIIFLIFYIIYEQIENNIIAPKIQGNALNLPVLIVLIAIIIGMYTFGLIGAIIAIPIAGCLKVLLEELPNLRETDS